MTTLFVILFGLVIGVFGYYLGLRHGREDTVDYFTDRVDRAVERSNELGRLVVRTVRNFTPIRGRKAITKNILTRKN